MTEAAFDSRLREFTVAAASDGDKSDKLELGRELKANISREITRLNLLLNTIDHLVATFIPDPKWQWGWLPDQAAVPRPTGRKKHDRSSRVAEIANELIATGADSVRTDEIAQRLRAEGDDASDRGLVTAAGNVLARSGWRRVARGTYEPPA